MEDRFERLAVQSLTVAFGQRRALDEISLEVEPQRTLAVVGPSGAGKSTLLRAIAGLVEPLQGQMYLGKRSLRGLPPQARRVALVLQDDTLVNTMSVRENLRFVRHARERGDARIEAMADALHVREHLDRRPRDLSGGERQRVGLARALLARPLGLLLDEPLAHVDPALRLQLRDEIAGLHASFEGPVLYVTHDHAEAMSVADELAVLIEGRIEDRGSPQRVYDSPRTTAVARALGERAMNLLATNESIVGIRAEHVRVDSHGAIAGLVTCREPTGADAYLYLRTHIGEVVARVASSDPVAAGDRVRIDFPDRWVRYFDPQTGRARA